MSRTETTENNLLFYSVGDGTFRLTVPENHPEAVQRNWELKDGTKGTKFEKQVKALFGTITNIQIHTGEYGKNLNIYLDKDEDGKTPVISVGVNTRYGGNLLKRLPNIKLDKEARFYPYDYVDDKDKRQIGISVAHQDADEKFTVKAKNAFYDGEKNLLGYPEATDEDKEDWAFYYKKADKFLVKYVEENICTKFAENKQEPVGDIEYPTEKNELDKVPF